MTLAIVIADSAWVRCESIGRTRAIHRVHAEYALRNVLGLEQLADGCAMESAVQSQTVSQGLIMFCVRRTNKDAPSREARGVMRGVRPTTFKRVGADVREILTQDPLQRKSAPNLRQCCENTSVGLQPVARKPARARHLLVWGTLRSRSCGFRPRVRRRGNSTTTQPNPRSFAEGTSVRALANQCAGVWPTTWAA